MTTPQTIMPLEETEMYLQQMLQHDPVDAAGVISIGCDAAANRGRIIRSALHHLEAGKRDSARYLKLRAHAESEFIQIEGHGFSGYFEEGRDLDAAIDCLPELSSITPTEGVQP